MKTNEMKLVIDAKSNNEAFARAVIGSFCAQLDPNVEEISDIKTAVSEAVTNAIVHAYENVPGKIYITAYTTDNNELYVKIKDKGIGIENVERAMQPLFTTGDDNRSGLGFSVMECFSDKLKVTSKEGRGTSVTIVKKVSGKYGNKAEH